MIPLRSSFLAAAGLALSLAAGSPAAQAGPALSYWSHEAEYDQDSCAQRAQASFGGDGWQSIQRTGSWPNAVR
jgi:hypothetical protein